MIILLFVFVFNLFYFFLTNLSNQVYISLLTINKVIIKLINLILVYDSFIKLLWKYIRFNLHYFRKWLGANQK